MADSGNVGPNGPTELEYIIDQTGVKRYLAKLAPTDFGKLKSFASAFPTLPRSEWKEVDNRDKFGAADWILDQGQHNSCVGNGVAGAARRSRVIRGQKDVKLSPSLIYSKINGNRDAGAVIGDALREMQRTGTCRYELQAQDPVYYSKATPTAKADSKNFIMGEAYRIGSFDEIATAIQLDFMPVYGIRVGQNFGSLNKWKIAPVLYGQTNHCMAGDGLKKVAGIWVIDNYNSWRYTWGDQGRCYLTEEHFAAGDGDFFVVRFMQDSPVDDVRVVLAS